LIFRKPAIIFPPVSNVPFVISSNTSSPSPRFRGLAARLLALLLVALFIFPAVLSAADPSDMFLRAYQEFQAGERSERDGRLRDALDRYATSVKSLENIQRMDPEWQKLVVDYRLKKARESLERLRASASETQIAEVVVEEPLPTGGFEIDIPEPMISTRPPEARGKSTQSAATGAEASRLQTQLAEARRQMENLKRDLEKTRGELTGAKAEIDRTKTSLVETRSRLVQAEVALDNVTAERDELKTRAAAPTDKRLEELSSRIAELEANNEFLTDDNSRLAGKLDRAAEFIEESKKTLAATDKDRRAVAKERDRAESRLKKLKDNDAEIARLQKERKELEAQFAKEKSDLEEKLASQQPRLDLLARLENENKELAERLDKAEAELKEAEKIKADHQRLVALQEEITLLQDRLVAARDELRVRDENIQKLLSQLDEATGEAARLRLDPKPTEEQKRLAAENELLKNIVLRQLREQSERSQAVGQLEQELEKLHVKSDSLSNQVAVLATPFTPLSEQEMALFREPVVLLGEPGGNEMGASLTMAKTPTGDMPESAPQGPEALSSQSRADVDEARQLVRARRFTDAEKIYTRLSEEYPENSFILANLAVTLIQAGKNSAALVALDKALSLSPGDVFASINKANVLARQDRFDESIEILKEVLKRDPKNAVANNYIAIALGKKGNYSEAEEFFQRSILLDENYANAHFNLAVMYANTAPPSLTLARKHYDIAISLGAEPDAVLDRRLAEVPPQPTPSPAPEN
jgi:tetratricopeptide (TPR) repeat protein